MFGLSADIAKQKENNTKGNGYGIFINGARNRTTSTLPRKKNIQEAEEKKWFLFEKKDLKRFLKTHKKKFTELFFIKIPDIQR